LGRSGIRCLAAFFLPWSLSFSILRAFFFAKAVVFFCRRNSVLSYEWPKKNEKRGLFVEKLALRTVITVDEEKCVNCHRCIAVCPAKMCNDGSGDVVKLNSDLCLGCGECLDACTHGARVAVDDSRDFFADLASGVKMVAIVAPAAAALKADYKQLTTYLKNSGIKAVFDVSFGAELTVKSYLEYIKEHNPKCIIAQPCPSLVTFIELYRPELFKYLAPVDSPMAHTMKMIREFYKEYNDCKIAVISPCYAKKREFDEIGLGDYNVTFKSLNTHFEENNIDLTQLAKTEYDGPMAERAVLFSSPGGLTRTIERHIPDAGSICRRIEGQPGVYSYLAHLGSAIEKGMAPVYRIIDCLNCEMGCNGGPGTLNRGEHADISEYNVENRNKDAQEFFKNKTFTKSKKAGYKIIDSLIQKYWKKDLYNRNYIDRSSVFKALVKKPSIEDISAINRATHKDNPRDILNCGACGYKSCEQMAVAIFNGRNKPENCRMYMSTEVKKTNEQHKVEIKETINTIVKSSAEKLKDNIEKISALTNESTDVVQSVSIASSSIEQMVASIVSITDVLNSNAQTVSNLHNSATDGQEDIAEIAKLIKTVTTHSDSLVAASSTIQQIANQTNLLAMNAAIEAAHAGSYGLGFAVVADEIRKLAEHSSKEAKTISASLKDIKKLIDQTELSSQKVQSGFVKVVDLSDQVKAEGTSIKNAVEEQNSGGSQLLEALSQIQRLTDIVNKDSKDLLASSNTVLTEISNLNETV